MAFLFFLPALCFGQEWKLAKSTEDLKVYTRPSPTSNFKDTKAEMVLRNTTLNRIKKAFREADSHVDWVYAIYRSELKEIDENSWVIYYVAGAPWPISDRDIISKYKLKESSNELSIEVVADATYLPEEDKFVRVKSAYTTLKFVKNGSNEIILDYFSHVDPGGWIPSWLANLKAPEAPFTTLSNLKKRLEVR